MGAVSFLLTAMMHSDSLHTGLVLDGAGDTEGNVDLRVNGLAGLTDLMVGSEPAGVDGNTAAADDAAEHVRQLFRQLDAALDVLGDTTADGDDVVGADQVNELLRGLDDLDDLGVHIGLAQGEAGLGDLAPRPPWPDRREPSSSRRGERSPWRDGSAGR